MSENRGCVIMERYMNMPSKFFKEEIRDGYKVSTKTKKIWAVEMDLLCELLRVCNKHNIEVFAFAGTLLGAIRHKGFIPWDDDIDICLTRGNYEKLLKIAEKEFEYPYFFQTAYSDKKYFFGYARLRNSETTGIINWNESVEYNNGIFIDIFVLDGYTDCLWKFKWQLLKRAVAKKFCSAYYAERQKEKGLRKFLITFLQSTLFKVTLYEDYVEKYNKVLKMYNKNSTRVALMTHGENYIVKYWCHKKDLEKSIYVPFENIELPIPANYDEILRHMYGDYMEFPPVDKRGAWHSESLIFDPDIPYRDYVMKR